MFRDFLYTSYKSSKQAKKVKRVVTRQPTDTNKEPTLTSQISQLTELNLYPIWTDQNERDRAVCVNAAVCTSINSAQNDRSQVIPYVVEQFRQQPNGAIIYDNKVTPFNFQSSTVTTNRSLDLDGQLTLNDIVPNDLTNLSFKMLPSRQEIPSQQEQEMHDKHSHFDSSSCSPYNGMYSVPCAATLCIFLEEDVACQSNSPGQQIVETYGDGVCDIPDPYNKHKHMENSNLGNI
jgi:hypothetical protein